MTKDVEWGPWIAHRGTEMPSDLNGYEAVQTWRIDLSNSYLPEGRGSNFEEETGFKSSLASDVNWENLPHNKMVVAYRVKKEPVVELRRVLVVECDYGETVDAQGTYTDGKLTKIHWEADQ